jgi:hypothetical protein
VIGIDYECPRCETKVSTEGRWLSRYGCGPRMECKHPWKQHARCMGCGAELFRVPDGPYKGWQLLHPLAVEVVP